MEISLVLMFYYSHYKSHASQYNRGINVCVYVHVVQLNRGNNKDTHMIYALAIQGNSSSGWCTI